MTKEQITEELKDIPIEEVAQELGIEIKNHKALCINPKHADKDPSLSFDINKNFFNCFGCNFGGDTIKLVQDKQQVDFLEARKWLVERFRLNLLPEIDKYKEEAPPEIKEFYGKAILYELLFDYGKKLLYEPKGKEALNYLLGRGGYTIENLKKTEWIYYPPEKEIRKYLLSQAPQAKELIHTLPLQGTGGDNFSRLALPYRNRRKFITGFAKRATDNKEQKYDSTKGLDKHDLFNLYKWKGAKELLIVEGYPDALYLPTLGIDNVVAIGEGILRDAHLEGLRVSKVERVIISFDNDPPKKDGTLTGTVNTEGAIEKLLSKTNITPFVIDPPLLSPHKDVDEFVLDKGIEALKGLMSNAERGAKWKAKRILSKYDQKKPLEEDKGIDEITHFGATLKDLIDREYVEKILSDWTDLPRNILKDVIAIQQEEKAKEQLEKRCKDLLNKALQENTPPKEIEDQIKDIRLDYEKGRIAPEKPLDEYLKEKYERDKARDPDTLLGYNLKTFKTLAEKIDGIQAGFYILGASTNIGKTAFLSNIFLDLLLTNSNVVGLYFSLDDNKDTIINKLISITTNMETNRIRKRQEDDKAQEKVKGAYDTFITLTQQGRFILKDISTVNHINTLELEIREKTGNDLIVVIDGLHNLEVGKDYGGIRELNIDRANRVKAIVDTYNIPVIVTGEIRKTTSGEKKRKPTIEDLMETGKFAYNANLVWMLYPESLLHAEKLADIEEPKELDEQTLILDYQKNKLSSFKGFQKLMFFPPRGIIEEEGKGGRYANL